MNLVDEIIMFLYTNFQVNPMQYVSYEQIFSHISESQIQISESEFFSTIPYLIEKNYIIEEAGHYRIARGGIKYAESLLSKDYEQASSKNRLFSSYTLFVAIFGIIVILIITFMESNDLILKTAQTNVWWYTIFATILGVLVNLVFSLLVDLINNKLLSDILKNIRNNISIESKKWFASVNLRISKISYIGSYLVKKVIPSINSLLSKIWFFLIVSPIKYLANRIIAPKWYKQKGVIDPGLIEVSLAVTAIIIALPAFSTANIFYMGWFRIISVALSIYVSLSFIDLYAKDRGSTSSTVLLSPISDGPFFLLSWVIIIGALLAIIAFLFSGAITPGEAGGV